ncbi:PAS domain-containing protein [Bordetella genomosp. 13]|uniref:PAS domain-containing sensor histidine kinase n=1 Tax=Bordetella genomosp. 13 TaxID=463040 RepID=UPI0011A4C3EE|nr:PAS domain-containing protein [Bordetella genomosp. 13]
MAGSVDWHDSDFRNEVAGRFGVLPNFFCSAPTAPGLVEELWVFAKSAYLDSPLPSLFKERLFVHLSRFCEVRYCIVRHAGFLAGHGHPAGDPAVAPLTLEQIMRLLRRPVPDAGRLAKAFEQLDACERPSALPAPDTDQETWLFDALTVAFLLPARAARARQAVRNSVGPQAFELIVAFLAFVRTAHYWTEMHPELDYEPDIIAYMARHPDLAALLVSSSEAAAAGRTLRQALGDLDQSEGAQHEREVLSIGLINGIAQATWETDGAGLVVADSPSWRAYTGQRLEQWLGEGRLEAIHPDDRERVRQQWQTVVTDGLKLDAEFRLWHADEQAYRWTNARAVPVRHDDGTVAKWLGMNIDISERKRAEAKLREREADLARVQRIGEVGGLDIDVAGGMRSWRSPEYRRLHGLQDEGEETHGQWLARVHPADRQQAQSVLMTALYGQGGTYDGEYRIVRPSDGAVRWIHARADIERNEYGQPVRLVGAHVDVTEQKQLQQALREREERQAFVLTLADALRPLAAPQAIQLEAARQLGLHLHADRAFYAEVDGQGQTVIGAQYRSPHTTSIPDRFRLDDFGVAPAQALRAGRTLVIFDVADWAALTEEVAGAYTKFDIAAQVKVPLVKEGRLVAFLGVHQRKPREWTTADVTLVEDIAERTWAAVERARAETAMRESEERLRSATEVGQLGLWDWNVTTGEVHWSDQHFRMAGYEVGAVRPSYEAWIARVHPDDREPAETALRHAMRTQQEFVREFRVVHDDGSIHWLYGRGRFFYDEGQRPVRMIGAMVETTERRDWEDRQKVLVGELQHRTRNLMAVVRSMADKTLRASVDLPDFRHRFRDRLDALARVQGLLSRLNEHDRVTFDELIRTELSAMEGASDRVVLDGPHGVRLRSSTVQMLAMALHELATNAVKYGALGQPQARLVVGWTFDPEGDKGKPWLHIDWRESGVDMPAPGAEPRGTGQGRELIEQALPYQLQARTVYTLERDGVHCRISLPVSLSTLEAD